MTLTPGLYDATIKSHSVGATNSGTPYVKLACEANSEDVSVFIYLSEKAMGMARASLRKCGFDCDKQDLSDLRDKPGLLAGTVVQITFEDDETYGARGQILLSSISDRRLKELTGQLRAVKKKGSTTADDGEDGDLPF